MDWMDRETQDKTIESYNVAMDKMLGVSSRVEPEGNFRTNPFPIEYRQLIATTNWQPSATRIWVTMDSLFNMGRPLHISERSWIWGSSFFKAKVHMGCSFEVFRWNPGTAGYAESVDEETGETIPGRESIPAEITSQSQALSLKLKEKGWGLKDWWAKHEEIEHFMDGASAELLDEWAGKVAEADKEVKKYEAAASAKPLLPVRGM